MGAMATQSKLSSQAEDRVVSSFNATSLGETDGTTKDKVASGLAKEVSLSEDEDPQVTKTFQIKSKNCIYPTSPNLRMNTHF